MYCEKCGEKIKEGNSFCTNCGTPKKIINKVEEKEENKVEVTPTVVVVNNAVDEDNKKANLLCTISVLLYFVGPLAIFIIALFSSLISRSLGSIISALSGATRIAAIVLMIVARVKYPNNTFAKVLMWIYIGLAILAAIFVVLFIVFLIIGIASFASLY